MMQKSLLSEWFTKKEAHSLEASLMSPHRNLRNKSEKQKVDVESFGIARTHCDYQTKKASSQGVDFLTALNHSKSKKNNLE